MNVTNLSLIGQGNFVPPGEPVAPPVLGPLAVDILSWAKGVGLVAGVLGLIVIGIMMVAGRRNRSQMAADGLGALPWIVGGFLLIGMSAQVADWAFGVGGEVDELTSQELELIDPVGQAVDRANRDREICLSRPSGEVLDLSLIHI